MQSNIPKLPNDIIFYILKLKRLKEGERIQKSIKNKQQNSFMICAMKNGYEPENVCKEIMTYDVLSEIYAMEDRKAMDILYNIYRERYENWIVFKEDKPKKLICPNWCKWKKSTDKEKHQIKLYKCFEKLYEDIVCERGWGYYDRDETKYHINKKQRTKNRDEDGCVIWEHKYYKGVYELRDIQRVGFSKYYGYESNMNAKREEEEDEFSIFYTF